METDAAALGEPWRHRALFAAGDGLVQCLFVLSRSSRRRSGGNGVVLAASDVLLSRRYPLGDKGGPTRFDDHDDPVLQTQ